MMNEENKTMSIPVMIQEVAETGLISQEALDALEHEKLKAEEQIQRLHQVYKEKIISHEMLEAAIRGIRKGLQDRILALGIDKT